VTTRPCPGVAPAALRARGALAALLAMVVLGAAPEGTARAAPPPYGFSRAVDVAAPGWTRVALDPTTRGHMAPDARDLRLWGPAGDEVPYRLVADAVSDAPAPIAARVAAVEEAPGGWLVTLDLGEDPPAHRRLAFDFANRAVVEGVRLEEEDDGGSWRLLAAADLFRLGESEALGRTQISYPPTTASRLRLRWPEAAGLPEVRGIAVEAAPAPGAEEALTGLRLPAEVAARGPGFAAYRLRLPGPGLSMRRLEVAWRGAGSVTARLMAPGDARWLTLAEGVLTRTAGGRPSAMTPAEHGGADVLRLELGAGGDAVVDLVRATALVVPEAVAFFAAVPGRHTLTYGGLGMAPPAYPLDVAPLAEARPVAAGPEAVHAPPPLPAALLVPGARVDVGSFRAVRRVTVASSPAADLARLGVPPDIYAEAQGDLDDLRLAWGDRQLPYVRWSPPEPVLVVEAVGLVPAPAAAGPTSLVSVTLPARRLPLSVVELAAPAAPFDRGITLRYAARGEPSAADREENVGFATWTCAGASSLPCRIAIELPPNSLETLEVAFADGDNAPLPEVDVRVWRRDDVLLFPWPQRPGASCGSWRAGRTSGRPATTSPP